MTGIGDTLREARIKRGLTIRDVEDATKIRGRYLQALEDEDFEALPGPVFAKAFLRTYASFLKLNADDLLEEYRRRYEPDKVEDSKLPKRATAVAPTTSRAAARRARSAGKQRQRGYFLVGLLAVIAVVLLAWLGSGRGREGGSTLEEATFPNATGTTVATTLAPGSGTTTSSSLAAATTTLLSRPVSSSENVVLTVNVTQGSCWMVVREDNENGAELYAGTLSAGGEQTFNSAKGYWLHVGEPSVLVLVVNGAPFSLDKNEHFYLVTAAGVKPAK